MNMSEENGRATDTTVENSKDEMSGRCLAAKTGETAADDDAVAAAAAAAAAISSESGPISSKKRKKKITAAKASNPAQKRTRRSPRLIQKEIDKKIWKTMFAIQNNERLMETAQKGFIELDAGNEKTRRNNNSNLHQIRSQIAELEQILERIPEGIPQVLLQNVHATRRRVDDALRSTLRMAESIDEQKRKMEKFRKDFFDAASLTNQQTIVELASLFVGGKVV